jgi:hypothetical protein
MFLAGERRMSPQPYTFISHSPWGIHTTVPVLSHKHRTLLPASSCALLTAFLVCNPALQAIIV